MQTQIRLLIQKRNPFAEGMVFASTGLYERLAGKVFFSVDPNSSNQREVVDIEKAPKNSEGLVEFSLDFYILKPLDMTRGNHRLLFEPVNRGNIHLLRTFNDAPDNNAPITAIHAGNAFLMRRGYILVWSGWQGDLVPGDNRITAEIPVATEQGNEITGMNQVEFIAGEPDVYSFPLSGNNLTKSYESATKDTGQCIFTCREFEKDSPITISPDQWQFARALKEHVTGQWQPFPSSTDCYLKSGFHSGWIYELIYPAKNPLVLGMGLVGVRDLISFFRYSDVDSEGIPNPLKEKGITIKKVYCWGISQSDRFQKEFVYRGFNEDEKKRRVFDAIFPQSAGAARLPLHRFAHPGRFSCQHEDHLYPSCSFPFSYATVKDTLTGKTDGILKRPATDPLVIQFLDSKDYWQVRASLMHTDSMGNDIILPENVRIYSLSSLSIHPPRPKEQNKCQYSLHISSIASNAISRALLDALDTWASGGPLPPPSRIPTCKDGTLVQAITANSTFPCIPGVICPTEPNRLPLLDYGTYFDCGIINYQPPKQIEGKEYTVLVPMVDDDGNEIAGIITPDIMAPLATHTGWNRRAEGFSLGELFNHMGSFFPFPQTAKERQVSGDPRKSVEERYGTHARYIRTVARAIEKMVSDGFLLEEDADRYIKDAINKKYFNLIAERA